MKAIMVLFDSLSRQFLPPYGNNWVKAPNFEHLAENTVTFDTCYAGSLPCMPARRDLHTGRYNFLHRSWGPLEPFDDSMPEILKNNGVYSHLISDHFHYWEDGGATYHGRYSSWECVRGQQGDKWKAEIADPDIPLHHGMCSRQDWINRKYMQREEETSQARTFDLGLEFLRTNHDQDNWFLQIECFDPHPPFFVPEKYRELYPQAHDTPLYDYPPYGPVKETETPKIIENVRHQYAALVSMCDNSLGRALAAMDAYSLWDDTMLIVTTDHGFHLGEHDWWAFVKPPAYDIAVRKPLFIWDPRCKRKNERNSQLVQFHDLPATLLEYFGVNLPDAMQGRPLGSTIATNAQVREACLTGVFGREVNCTDGRYMYMRAPANRENGPLFNYTLMPCHMTRRFSMEELRTSELAPPFTFTKACPVLRIQAEPFMGNPGQTQNLLFDLENDPEQEQPITDHAGEQRMIRLMVRLMQENDAPPEQFERMGLLEYL